MAHVSWNQVYVKLTWVAAPMPLEVLLNLAETRDGERRLNDPDVLDFVDTMQRRTSIALNYAGKVNADYTIFVPEGIQAAGLAGELQRIDNSMATAALSRAMRESPMTH